MLESLTSSETSENTLLIESDWLGLVELLLLAHFFHFSHSSLFLIKIIQYILKI